MAVLRVLQSFRPGRTTTNPYLSQLVESLPSDIVWEGFSWRAALVGRYDVLHVHWPEVLLRGSSPPKTALRRLFFVAMVVRIRLLRRRIVRTLHNESAHETGSAIERWLLGVMDRATDVWIRLTPSTQPPTAAPVRTIPHGDYRRWFERHELPEPIAGRVLYFGLVRPYKGIEELVDVFREIHDPTASLRIVGSPQSSALARNIAERALADSRISHALQYVDDASLAREVGESSLVVLPYRRMHNSGALLLALSLGRPVLVPSNEVTIALSAEVGAGWIRTFEGTVSAAAIENALAAPIPIKAPDFVGREWAAIGPAHAAVYRLATENSRTHRAWGVL